MIGLANVHTGSVRVESKQSLKGVSLPAMTYEKYQKRLREQVSVCAQLRWHLYTSLAAPAAVGRDLGM